MAKRIVNIYYYARSFINLDAASANFNNPKKKRGREREEQERNLRKGGEKNMD